MTKILIADDEKNIRAGIRKILSESINEEVCFLEARNGSEALELAVRERPNIVITDIRMPKMDGIELMSRIRSEIRECKVYIIVLSGYDEFIYAQQAITYQASAYLLKPLDREALSRTVKAAIAELNALQGMESGSAHERTREPAAHIASEQSGSEVGDSKKTAADQTYHSYIEDALVWINKHFTEDINMMQAANHVSVNYTYFSGKFKEHTGLHFSEYLKRLRINNAMRLLSIGNYRVYEAAWKSGYHDVKYFFRHFKEVTGLTPGEFSRSCIDEE
ncbi:MAG: response regulator [Treponema sp.]|jgi:two-component system response regulator YesN|nr:response regulator [Treponema sp.]